MNSEFENNVITNRDKLVKTYIGNNYESFINGGYSYACLFLGWLYLFYRKSYKLAFMLIFLNILIITTYAFLINHFLLLILEFVTLLISFFIGGTFKSNYLTLANQYVDSIINENISFEEKLIKCKKKGGVDNKVYLMVILVALISYVIFYESSKVLANHELILHFHPDLQSALNNRIEKTYKENKHDYYIMNFTYEDDESKCNFEILKGNKYVIDNEEERDSIYDRYLYDNYTISLPSNYVTYNGIQSKEYINDNTFYYIYGDKKSINLIKIEIEKNENNKCTIYKDYIMEHMEIS